MARPLVLVVLVCSCLTGCSGDGMPPLSPVSGTVKLANGTPVTYATIVFTPDAAAGTQGPVASCSVDGAGRYSLRTAGQHTGATVGRHIVTIEAEYQPDIPASKRANIPSIYANRKTSPLKVEVIANQDNVIDLKLSP